MNCIQCEKPLFCPDRCFWCTWIPPGFRYLWMDHKRLILAVLAFLLFLHLFTAYAGAQLYPSDPPLLGPIQRDCYGPAMSCDGTGRAFYWAPQEQNSPQPNVTIQPEVNRYGFGSSSDQYGRPIAPQFGQERRSSRFPGFGSRGRIEQTEEDK